jgi:hypothetical protein
MLIMGEGLGMTRDESFHVAHEGRRLLPPGGPYGVSNEVVKGIGKVFVVKQRMDKLGSQFRCAELRTGSSC